MATKRQESVRYANNTIPSFNMHILTTELFITSCSKHSYSPDDRTFKGHWHAISDMTSMLAACSGPYNVVCDISHLVSGLLQYIMSSLVHCDGTVEKPSPLPKLTYYLPRSIYLAGYWRPLLTH